MTDKEKEEAIRKAVEHTAKTFTVDEICGTEDDMSYETRWHRMNKRNGW
jgi:hypothetical protein